MSKDKKVCVLCGESFKGHGNNPAPLKDKGECCDECNKRKVIPARIKALREKKRIDEARENEEDIEGYTLRTAKSIKRAEDLLNSDVYDALRGEIYRTAEDNEYLDVCDAMLMTYDDDDSRYYYYDVADEAKAMMDAIKDANDWDDVIDEMMDFYAVAADSGVNESKVARRHTIKEAATHRRTPFSIDREGFEFDDNYTWDRPEKEEEECLQYDDEYRR